MQYEPRSPRFLLSVCTVMALGIGALLPAGAASWEQPRGVHAYAFQSRVGEPGAKIRVGWGRPDDVLSSQVIGYIVWRGGPQSPWERVMGLDSDARRAFVDNESPRTFFAWDAAPASDEIGSREEFTAGGIAPGQVYRYQVAVAYRNGFQDRDRDGEPDVGAQFMSPLSAVSNRVTAIEPATISAINNEPAGSNSVVDLNNVLVEWQQTPGADEYVIWVSKDPTFRRGKLKFKVPKTVPVDFGGPASVVHTISIRKKAYLRADRLYVAVGARNSHDRFKPRPFGAIFSTPVQLLVESTPPSTP